MANMSYCRFENTLRDLQDCYDHLWDDKELSASEKRAMEKLIDLCGRIAYEFETVTPPYIFSEE